MAILEIDTDVLHQTVSIAKNTNDAITEAFGFLNSIVIHKDWDADERRVLNEYTITNLAKAKQLQTNSTSFYHAIEHTSQIFLDTEQESIREINTLEALISSIASAVPEKWWGGVASSVGSTGVVLFNNVKEALGG